MNGLHELAVLLELPNGYKLYYCVAHCGRIVMVRDEPFDIKILLTGDDEAMHKITEEDSEVVSVVLDEIEPKEMDKYMCRLEALNHNLVYDLFHGAGVEGFIVG